MVKRILLAGVATVFCCGCGSAPTERSGPRPRVVSWSPALTQMLFDMGLGEHVIAVTLGAVPVTDLDLGFSFNVVTNLDGTRNGVWSVYTGQGTLDMFLRNATAITVHNTMRFVPALPANMTGPVFGGKWWRIDMDGFSSPFIFNDVDTTVDGTAFELDIAEIRRELGDVPLWHPLVRQWLKATLSEGLASLNSPSEGLS